ncbi:ATP-dependent DNA helicase RecQ-like [Dreissena polymorpha]|uniref:ATP-dependent DNA helicase RecQ-like n=1 Tax=Dreissena polymorpha TaxID=45954 RepID=UPI0022649AE4|nr:ATP-dependent DNA helicase RecQ-like [Dreissena polymorpha]
MSGTGFQTCLQRSICSAKYYKPNLVLTATATKSIQRNIYEHLGFKVEETKVVAALPDRPNIFLDMRASTDKYENELAWVLNHLISDVKQKKIIIYVRSINICYNLYLWIVSEMKHHFFVNDSPSLQNRRVEMFHANTDKDSKDRIMEQFIKEDGNIQVLISTVAFGMGINIPDVSIVVHWGLPATSLSYWQEVGRCARDGRKGYAVCYGFKRSISKCEEEEMKECIKLENCLRFAVLAQFQLDGMPEQFLQALKITKYCINGCQHCSCSKCQCCTVCCSLCTCEGKIDGPLNAFLIS